MAGTERQRRAGIATSWPDLVLAAAVGVVQVVGTHMAGMHEPDARHVDLLGLILLLVAPLALVVRRRWPVQVYAVVFAATAAYQALGYVRGPEWFGLLVAFATVVMAGQRRIAVAGLLAAYVWSQWLPPLLGTGHAPQLWFALAVLAWLLLLLGVAEWLRLRRLRATQAAHLRREEARRQVSEERLEIARELHDVLAQNISLINVQAATTLFQLDGGDERAVRALTTIKQVSHETLLALRSVLGALRAEENAPRAPAASIGRMDDLVARAATLGVTARVEQRGAARLLPPSIDLAAYRILQEALTNVARHSQARTARVEVTYREADLVVQVDDDGQLRAPFAAGTGITGMTERAAALGGDLQAGPRPGGGFRVRARLPLSGAR